MGEHNQKACEERYRATLRKRSDARIEQLPALSSRRLEDLLLRMSAGKYVSETAEDVERSVKAMLVASCTLSYVSRLPMTQERREQMICHGARFFMHAHHLDQVLGPKSAVS